MRSLFKILVIGSMVFGSGMASAFPELIREGYQKCSACHVSPTGGGALNDYGQGIAGQRLSTWGTDTEAETFYGLFNIKPFGLHGDYRYLAHRYEDENIVLNQKFVMQRELALTFAPAKNVSFLFSGGYYGYEPKEIEYRKYFLNVGWGSTMFRVGRFRPAFGYEIPDHSKGIREIFGQGQESSNVELSSSFKYGELFLTRVFGQEAVLGASKSPKVNIKDQEGYTARGTVFIAKGIQAGASYAYLESEEKIETLSSVHAFAGTKRFYSLVEFQFKKDDRPLYAEVGWEVFQGFHMKAELDRKRLEDEYFGTFQWFPRPHWEFTVSGSQKNFIGTSHYYL